MRKGKEHTVFIQEGRYLYPFKDMKRGDWFEVPDRKRCAPAALWAARQYTMHFSLSKGEDGVVRCFRTD